jgi:hypothetical protein
MLKGFTLFKRPELYFYILALVFMLTLFGIDPESTSINLGVITFNNIKVQNLPQLLSFGLIGLGIFCVFLNAPYFSKEYTKAITLNKKLNEFVNSGLRSITNNQRDSVNKASLSGWKSPEVNTGSWTSYKMAREAVVIFIPQALAIPVRILAMAASIFITAPRFLIPMLTAITFTVWHLTKASI